MTRMFSFISEKPRNPVGGECPYNCRYCWAQSMVGRFGMNRYMGPATFDARSLKPTPLEGAFYFIGDMRDIFSPDVPNDTLTALIEWTRQNPQARFLFLTKNPQRYISLISQGIEFPGNVVLGVTIESNRNYPDLSRAPNQDDRVYWTMLLAGLMARRRMFKQAANDLFVSIEPILDFDLMAFGTALFLMKPWGVAVGYDNYRKKLPEPSLEKTMQLIGKLETFTKVYRKTLGEPRQ